MSFFASLSEAFLPAFASRAFSDARHDVVYHLAQHGVDVFHGVDADDLVAVPLDEGLVGIQGLEVVDDLRQAALRC